MMVTVGTKLLHEIERVSGLRQRYRDLDGRPGINVKPVLFLMDRTISEAKDAIHSDDPARAIAAMNELEGFTE